MAMWPPDKWSKRGRGAIAVIAYAGSIAVNFFTSGHPYAGIGLIVAAVIWNIYLFWPEIKLLRITYPPGSLLESPRWLYLFGLTSLGIVGLAIFLFYQAAAYQPRLLSIEEFSQPYIHGKYFKIADLADTKNTIQGRTFEDCYIYGPAVLFGVEENDLGHSYFDAGFDDIFLIGSSAAKVSIRGGVIFLRDCKFRRCHFSKVSFLGTSAEIEKWKKGNTEGSK